MFESSFDAHKYPVVVDIMVLFENKNMSLWKKLISAAFQLKIN